MSRREAALVARFPLGTRVRQQGLVNAGDGRPALFEVVGYWRGYLRLRSALETTHYAAANELETVWTAA